MLSTVATTFAMASAAMAASISVTPHDIYSSSIGVPGCLVDTNRIAYWPIQPGCDSVCVKVTGANGQSLNLLAIDTSGGAYDISYDAWNILNTGVSATENPSMGGGIPAEWESVPMSDCADLIRTPDKKLPLLAANSVGFYVGCMGQPMENELALYNIYNPACTYGFNEVCTLDLAVSNQPSCPHMLGSMNPLSGLPVENIQYGTGAVVAGA